MTKLKECIKDYKLECVSAPFFKMLEAVFELLVPLIMASIINIGILNHDKYFILSRCGILILLGVGGMVCSIIAQYFSAKAAVGISSRLRRDLFVHINQLGFTEMDRIGASTLITRMTSDINQVQNGLNLFLRLFLRSPFVVVGSMIMAFTIDFKVALIFVVAIPLISLAVSTIIIITKPLYKKVQKDLDKILSITRENLTGARIIRAFGREEWEKDNFRLKNQGYANKQLFAGRISSIMNPVTYVIVNLCIVAILNIGTRKVNQGSLRQGDVIALVSYMSQILVEIVKLANLMIQVTKGLASANRINEIFVMQNKMEFADNQVDMVMEEAIRFDKVSLTYEGSRAPSLSNISFSIKRGETLGIIGGTGAGKSTLVNLIPRFYDSKEGEIRIFGENIKTYSKGQLRSIIGVVPQKAQLYSGTIRSNLLWGNEEATNEDLWEALHIAQAEEFVKNKSMQLNETVEQGGRNLSGGQKQRLTIARAIVSKPKILILDDSASALDLATDAALNKAIKKNTKDMTVIVVSQRTSSIINADKILVLDDGHLAGIGTHNELVESCSVYKEIYYSQFKKGVTVNEIQK